MILHLPDPSNSIAVAVPCVLVIAILSVVAVFAVKAISPAVSIERVEVLSPVIETPPTVDVNAIAALSVPLVLVKVIVSANPTLVVNEMPKILLHLF